MHLCILALYVQHTCIHTTQTGLTKLGNTVVGGSSGPGLSGGQKKRLAVALQLLKLPTVILLDEPTSGESQHHADSIVTSRYIAT